MHLNTPFLIKNRKLLLFFGCCCCCFTWNQFRSFAIEYVGGLFVSAALIRHQIASERAHTHAHGFSWLYSVIRCYCSGEFCGCVNNCWIIGELAIWNECARSFTYKCGRQSLMKKIIITIAMYMSAHSSASLLSGSTLAH